MVSGAPCRINRTLGSFRPSAPVSAGRETLASGPATRFQRVRSRLGAIERRALLPLALALVPVALLLVSFGDPAGDTDEWPLPEFAEPSGLVYHGARDSLFVVGDEGDIAEISLDGRLLRSSHIGGDLEAIAVDPAGGMLYVVREGHEIIFEVDPDRLEIGRRFSIDRTFEGDPNYLKRGGDGIEGLTFVPDSAHAEGGRFYAVNQFDPAVLLELAVPIRSSEETYETAHIVRAREVASGPLSGVVWSGALDGFIIVSSLWRRAYVTDRDGELLRTVRVPGLMPEGLAPLPGGRFAIAQDTGGLLLWKPKTNPFAGSVASADGS